MSTLPPVGALAKAVHNDTLGCTLFRASESCVIRLGSVPGQCATVPALRIEQDGQTSTLILGPGLRVDFYGGPWEEELWP